MPDRDNESQTPEQAIVLRLRELNRSSSWAKIALMGEWSPIPGGTLSSISTGYPVPDKWRPRLDLPPKSKVIVVLGEVPSGSQCIGADICILCGRPYVSNHPRRKRCFVCSPYGGKKR